MSSYRDSTDLSRQLKNIFGKLKLKSYAFNVKMRKYLYLYDLLLVATSNLHEFSGCHNFLFN